MFNNISWQGYWVSIALFTAGYYLVIYLLYFRKDFSVEWKKGAALRSENPFSSTAADSAASTTATIELPAMPDNSGDFQPPVAGTIESDVYACIDEVSAYLEQAKRTRCVKAEMVYALRSILRKYPAIAASEYKESVTAVLINQCEWHCSVHLSADDVVSVWVEA